MPGCNKAIKVKQLTGSWKMSNVDAEVLSTTTTTYSYAGDDCDDSNASDNDLTRATIAYDGANVNFTLADEDDSETQTYDLTVNVIINDNGTYQVTGTYKSLIGGNVINREGTFATDLNEWYFVDGEEKNSAVIFKNFPVVFEANFDGDFTYQDITLDVEDVSGDQLVFTTNSSLSNQESLQTDESGDCVVTSNTTQTTNLDVTITLSAL